MKANALALFLVAVVGISAADAAQAQPPAASVASKPGTIRGRITAVDTGKPLRRAQVNLIPVNQSTDRRSLPPAFTNAGGQYELQGVPPGSYYVSASRAGYVSTQHGQRRAGTKGVTIEVRSGDTQDRIDIALPRGAVLAGTVVDDNGDPFPGVSVDALVIEYDHGRRVPSPVAGVFTDDLGRFRIPGLEPGSYYVQASTSETWRNDRNEALGYASSIYPGGTFDRAQRITLEASEIRDGLYMALQPSRAVRVSGRVLRESGDAASGTGVMLAYSFPGAMMTAGIRTIRTDTDGTFQFKDVSGGNYIVDGGGVEQDVAVAGVDIDNVVLVSRTGSTVTGIVTTDDGTAPPFETSGVRVLIDAPYGRVLPTVRVVGVESNWSFKLTSLGGPFLFRLLGIPDDWMLGSVTLGDRDITDVAWDVPTGGRQIDGLTLMVTKKVGRVSGTVADPDGKATSDATIVVFADDPDLWVPGSRRVQAMRPGSDGKFSIKGLPGGTYCAVARALLEEGQFASPEFLEEARVGAVTFTIEEGASATVSLTVRR